MYKSHQFMIIEYFHQGIVVWLIFISFDFKIMCVLTLTQFKGSFDSK